MLHELELLPPSAPLTPSARSEPPSATSTKLLSSTLTSSTATAAAISRILPRHNSPRHTSLLPILLHCPARRPLGREPAPGHRPCTAGTACADYSPSRSCSFGSADSVVLVRSFQSGSKYRSFVLVGWTRRRVASSTSAPPNMR